MPFWTLSLPRCIHLSFQQLARTAHILGVVAKFNHIWILLNFNSVFWTLSLWIRKKTSRASVRVYTFHSYSQLSLLTETQTTYTIWILTPTYMDQGRKAGCLGWRKSCQAHSAGLNIGEMFPILLLVLSTRTLISVDSNMSKDPEREGIQTICAFECL